MTMRVGRHDRLAVIGHPVIRKKPSADDAVIVAGGIQRRQTTPDRITPGRHAGSDSHGADGFSGQQSSETGEPPTR